MSVGDPDALIYARYALFDYVYSGKQGASQYTRLVSAGINLRGLIRTSLIKRLESSVEAFRKSVQRQVTVHRNFLTALDKRHDRRG